jgi:ethanolamine ammonia-lyase small subunit
MKTIAILMLILLTSTLTSTCIADVTVSIFYSDGTNTQSFQKTYNNLIDGIHDEIIFNTNMTEINWMNKK